jgi:ABC-type glycerol-3-phosphate transport system permease component
MDKKKKTFSLGQMISHIILFILLLLVMYPIFLMIIKSFKTIDQEIHFPFDITLPIQWSNYSLAWKYISSYILNTVSISMICTVGIVLVCSCMAFGFSRYDFPLKNIFFMLVLAVMMVPGVLTLIPQYSMVKDFGMINTRLGVILPTIAGAVPFGTLLLKTFFGGLPDSLFEAADIDGANSFTKYIKIALPLSVPIIATLGLTSFLNSWNDLIWPQLILRKDSLQTLTIALTSFTTNYYSTTHSYAVPLAGFVIASAPLIILFMLTSKQFISGLTSGAIKM